MYTIFSNTKHRHTNSMYLKNIRFYILIKYYFTVSFIKKNLHFFWYTFRVWTYWMYSFQDGTMTPVWAVQYSPDMGELCSIDSWIKDTLPFLSPSSGVFTMEDVRGIDKIPVSVMEELNLRQIEAINTNLITWKKTMRVEEGIQNRRGAMIHYSQHWPF